MKGRSINLSVHHDAVHFMEAVTRGPRADEARKVFYDSRRHNYLVIVSQIILGEIVAVILRKYGSYGEHEAALGRLLKVIYDSGAEIGRSFATFDPWKLRGMVRDLSELDSRLKRTDLIVLALALADPHSVRLFTRDNVLLENTRIMEYEARLRGEGKRNVRLLITDML